MVDDSAIYLSSAVVHYKMSKWISLNVENAAKEAVKPDICGLFVAQYFVYFTLNPKHFFPVGSKSECLSSKKGSKVELYSRKCKN